VKDLFGNYDIAFLVTLILAVVGLALAAVMLKAPRKAPEN
jgi:hypothetical protein